MISLDSLTMQLKKKDKSFWNIPVLGTLDDLNKYPDAALVIGIANPLVKKKILLKIGDHQ